MNFAKKQLEKYGWSEGKGLGKKGDGIPSALRPQRKVDRAGLGHDPGRDFADKWWEHVFDASARSIEVDVKDGDVQIKSTRPSDVTIETSSIRDPYGSFVKSSTLIGNTAIESTPFNSKSLTDEELFRACSNRTGHKGARHGIRQNGKLSRVEKQEKMMLNKMSKVSQKKEEKFKKKTKKCRM